ncbi:MAG: hypothetical protein O8C61_03750 [Candidatus Methanoperedens sp.]|nr:hypothetical protein [Candidatus Methanoperedens sp.]
MIIMPYAAKDRQEFIKRSNINPDTRILDIGGMLCGEIPGAVFGIPSKRTLQNAVLIRPLLLPFKSSVFKSVVSYHYFDLVPPEKLDYVFEEAARVLDKDGSFSFMILHWMAFNEAQRSNLLFNEVLKSTGALYQHDIEKISNKLNSLGFNEITVESIKREIPVPIEFFQDHMLMLGNLVKLEKTHGLAGIKALAKQYFHQVKEHGESMLPAIHFIARK